MLDLHRIRQRARRIVKNRWLRYALKDVSNNDNHLGLERIYRVTDPWSLDTPVEHARFDGTNQEIEKRFGKVGSILEIGSGEGLQSTYLKRLCNSLHGVEVSGTAVERARQRLPDSQFYVGDLAQQPWIKEGKRFDLVVACEVLYYVSDVPSTLQLMNRIGDACFVSYYAPEAYKLSAIVDAIPNVQKSWLTRDNRTWLFAWWKNLPNAVSKSLRTANGSLVWLAGYLHFYVDLLLTETPVLMLA